MEWLIVISVWFSEVAPEKISLLSLLEGAI
jgi:hypothetical protein